MSKSEDSSSVLATWLSCQDTLNTTFWHGSSEEIQTMSIAKTSTATASTLPPLSIVVSSAAADKQLTETSLRVLIALSSRGNRLKGDLAFPSVETVSLDTNTHPREVRKAIKVLVKTGYIECVGTTARGVKKYRIIRPGSSPPNLSPTTGIKNGEVRTASPLGESPMANHLRPVGIPPPNREEPKNREEPPPPTSISEPVVSKQVGGGFPSSATQPTSVFPAIINESYHPPLLSLLRRAPAQDQEVLIHELADQLGKRTINNIPAYMASLVKKSKMGTFFSGTFQHKQEQAAAAVREEQAAKEQAAKEQSAKEQSDRRSAAIDLYINSLSPQYLQNIFKSWQKTLSMGGCVETMGKKFGWSCRTVQTAFRSWVADEVMEQCP